MRFSLLFVFVIVVGTYCYNFSEAREPVCSKFAYEEQLLEKMIRTEIKVETMVNENKKTEDNVIRTLSDIKQAVADFTDMFADMRGNISDEMLKRNDEIDRREGSLKKLFEETRTNLTSDMEAKREELTQQQESFKKLFEETRTNLTSDMEAKREELTQLQGKLERPPIAFHAHQVKDLVLDTPDEIVIFSKSVINEGTGYDTSTGIFTAPVRGLYQFSVHTCVYYGKFAYIGLVLEGKVIAADMNYDNDQYTCSAFGAIARVKSGEKVWVKSTASSSNYQLYQDISTLMFSASTIKLNNVYDVIDIERLEQNGEYDVTQTYARIDIDPNSSFTLEYLVFGIELSRKYSYYLINIVLPVFFMQLLGLVVFAVPTDSGEKLSFALTLLLSLTVMMTLVAEKIPTTSLQIPFQKYTPCLPFCQTPVIPRERNMYTIRRFLREAVSSSGLRSSKIVLIHSGIN
ncbi:uncharacterized protein LOC132739214 [Ruditapes philippinarum]|uniref:uncharacterized protein LOC132739214 n=1 Tax=Ruditapes philippinarum TaxID=129788 RepID=UPI00295BFAC6|nr:uncharacterized protein LOC132739214 [Ruditapes philippinarum]